LAYGTTRLRGRLDHLLERFVPRGLHKTDSVLVEILRLGAYQLVVLGGVPDYAAVSEAVGQARAARGARAAGFVNAVLRRVAAEGATPEAFPSRDEDPVGFLSAWGSHPRWLVERWLGQWSFEEALRLVEADNRKPDHYLTPVGTSTSELLQALVGAGIEGQAIDGGGCSVRLPAGVSPAQALACAPRAVVQDPAAALVAAYADVSRGTIVADLCAAPGGKALALRAGARVVASDRSETRLRMVAENADRTNRSLDLVVADARKPAVRGVDVVLLDVPCTGTGTLARHPDARWRLSPESVEKMVEIQGAMLDGATSALNVGGLLVYSTCSLEPEENELMIGRFLDRHAEFVMDPSDTVDARYLDGTGCLRVTPQTSGFDGAFAARMRRVA
jgi:16S rRNA (cytosine967-C5)-methyltransferase